MAGLLNPRSESQVLPLAPTPPPPPTIPAQFGHSTPPLASVTADRQFVPT